MEHFRSLSSFALLLFTIGLMFEPNGTKAIEGTCPERTSVPAENCCKRLSSLRHNLDNETTNGKNNELVLCLQAYTIPILRSEKNPVPTLKECTFQCLFNITKTLTPDLKLNKTAVLTESNLDGIGVDTLTSCFEQSGKEVKETAICRSGSFQFMRCILRHKILNCPMDSWIESEDCKKYRDIVENCPNWL